MELQLADKNKLIEVLFVIRECSQQLIDKGIKYWNNSHADYEEISHDISNNFVYLLVINKLTVGTVTIKPDKEDSKISVISRLAIFPHYQNRGFSQDTLKFAEEVSRKNGSTTLKGSTPLEDKMLVQLLEQNGFVNMGADSDIPEEFTRIKFEKKI